MNIMKLYYSLLALVVLSACREAPRRTEAAAPSVPARGATAAVVAAEWPNVYEAIGTVQARTSAVISSKVMGYVRAVHVRAGDRVREGQPLVELDSRDLDAGYRQADAVRQEARSAAPEADNAVAAAKANLDLAQVTFNRMRDLFAKKSVSNQEMDEAAARLKAAQAAHAMAQSKRAQIDARIAQAEQGRKAAEILREYAQIRAPFAGVVTSKTVDPGVLATPGAPLLTLEREGAYRLEAPVEESRAIRAGQAVSVTLEAIGKTAEMRVSEVTPAVDAASRTYVVKIDMPAMAGLRSGMFGRARFRLGSRKVLAAPAAALRQQGQLQSVLVEEDGATRTRLVTTGERAGDQVEVLSGLSAGERVVLP